MDVTGAHQDAIGRIRQAIALDPSQMVLHDYLGLAWQAIGDLPEALDAQISSVERYLRLVSTAY